MTDWTPAAAHDAADATADDGADTAHVAVGEPEPLDLAAIERDLEGVEVALQRLDAGTYWTDEVTGERLPDELLERDPTARRLT